MTSAFIPGIGQHRHGIAERPQHAQHVLPGRGQVMHIARQHVRDPQRDPGRDCDNPKPRPSRGISPLSRNQASANTACL